ncbi:MAG TPA: sulfotransferase [Phycisphaerales bacterium]|nr:sulfotransferase [Phycisphaerales bacterium]
MSQATVAGALELYNRGQFKEAEQTCLDALRSDPTNADGYRLLGRIARDVGRYEQAVEALKFAVRARPGDPNLAGELGMSMVLAGKPEEATPLLEQVAAALPNDALSHYWLGRAHLAQFHGARAARHFRTAYELAPQNEEIMSMIGAGLLSAGRGREAEPWLREYARKHPESAEAKLNLASALRQQTRFDEAAQLHQQVLAADPDNAGAIAGLARYYRSQGKYDEALRLVTGALDRLGPKADIATSYAILCERGDRVQDGIAMVERALAQGPLVPQAALGLHFAMGRLQEKAGNYDGAWEAFSRGNALYPNTYNAQRAEFVTNDLMNTFNAWTFSGMPKARIATDKPVFVVGMPRSGTTLVEQILSSHPECFGAGELLILPQLGVELARRLGGRWPAGINAITPELADEYASRYLEHLSAVAPDARRVVDKLPHNFTMIGLMCVLFPQARVIHCIRAPLDVCVSNFATPLSPEHNYRPRLDTLGHAYNEYRKLMEHWRDNATIPILDVVYEDLTADVERQARRIVEFVGLPWDDRCLRFYEHSRAVTTASTDQVRQPIYQSSKERWRHYEKHLGPLIATLKEGGTNIERPFVVQKA